jgi:4-hydroxybenzoate polyprenyltransferase
VLGGFFKFLTSTSLFLALNGALVVLFSYFLYGLTISISIVLIAFLSIFSVYGLNKATDKAEDSINRPEVASRHKVYYLVPSLIALLVSITIGVIDGITVLLIMITPLLIGIIYSVKISPSMPRLKEIVGVKSIAVAFSWAFTGSLLPAAMQSVPAEKIALVFMYIFIQLLVNTVIFDTLDIEGDAFSGVKTIPIALGKSKTRKLLLMLNSSLGLWLAYCMFDGIFFACLPALTFGVIYGYVLIWGFLNRTNKRFYADLFVDGQWLPIIAILRVIIR